MFEYPPQTSLHLITLGYMYVYLQNDLHNIIIFKQFIGQTSDKLHGHNSYMQLIFSLIHKQDSISLPMNKQSLAGVYNATTQKKKTSAYETTSSLSQYCYSCMEVKKI